MARRSTSSAVGLANPIGMVLSAALMLDDLGLHDSADRVQRAVAAACAEGVLTPDVGGSATTDEVAAAIVRGL